MTPTQAAIRQATVDSSRAELLRELQLAHLIIGNASQLMSPLQRQVWAERNARASVTGHGPARDVERAAVIAKAAGDAA